MPTIPHTNIPSPKSWDEFEDIVCSAAKNRWKNPDFTRHGRQGQSQHGVDIYGKNQQGSLVGLQCKNTLEGITNKLIMTEIQSAEEFKPRLSMLYIATTSPTDKTIQEFTRILTVNRENEGSFGVQVLFWNDIVHDLSLDEDRLYQHYPQFKPQTLNSNTPSHDQKLFQEFQELFPYEPTVKLLNEHDFGGPFRRVWIQPLFDFVETWNQPEKEFLDLELQNALLKFYEAAQNMSHHLVEKTVPIGNNEFASVFSDTLREAGPRPDWVIKEAQTLNEQATIFVPQYIEFIRLCRSKLIK